MSWRWVAAALLFASLLPPAWLVGHAMLPSAKSLENMEIGHNVLHGQWDFASPAEAWMHLHDFVHHTYTNVIGNDRDIGYSALRISPEQRWHPDYHAQPVYNLVLAALPE